MSAMKLRLSCLFASVVVLLLLATACGPVPTPTPEARPPAGETVTPPAPTFTPTSGAATSPPTSVPDTATFTPSPIPSTPTFTATPIPPTPTFTSTPVPPTATFTLTPVPPTPTSTPVPPTATSTATPTPPRITDWRGEYYANLTLTSPSALVRNDRVVDFAFASGGSPAASVPTENWSARWTRTWDFAEGNYRFRAIVDDGARLWVDEALIIDAWMDGPPREFTANLYLKGEVSIRLEYYNHLGSARVRLNWERVTEYPDWMGSYFPNRDLTGLPRLQRNDQVLDLNFGAGAPVPYLPADNFSARWTRQLYLDQTGTYGFRLVSDDGARLWIDDRLVIDVWHDGLSSNEAFLELGAGWHGVRLEFYEHLGGALIQLTWSFMAPPATPTFTPSPIPPTPTYTPTPIPPTPTFTPTPLSPPPEPQPSIILKPPAGPVGRPVAVIGQGWPGNAPVDLSLAEVGGPNDKVRPVGDAVADAQGRFLTQIVVPRGEGWEERQAVRVVAQSAAMPEAVATAIYQLEPETEGVPVPFRAIAAEQERLALSEPAFLVLTSADEWGSHFGPEPAPADPAVNWQQEVVIGVFLGLQPPEAAAQVASIQRRGQEIVVRLDSPVLLSPETTGEDWQVARTLVGVSRSALPEGAQPDLANVDFSFFDGAGQLLASGTGTSMALTGEEREMQMLEAPQAEGAAPEIGAEALPMPGAEEGLKAAPSERAFEPSPQPTQAVAGGPRATQMAVGWFGFGLWIVLVVGLGVAVGLLIQRSRRPK
jgi:hypothetical protein